MPNTFIDNRDAWLRLAEIDYLGQFVKTWLAFNAWYRTAYTENNDREIINEIKWNPSGTLGNRMRPLLTSTSDDSAQFRAEIGLLHHRLENYEINEGKGEKKRRITLTNIYLKNNSPGRNSDTYRGYEFCVELRANGHIITEVKRIKDGWMALHHTQPQHDLNDLERQAAYRNNLPSTVQPLVRGLYIQSTPKQYTNLLDGSEPCIECGAYRFSCGREVLFAGVIEALYLMRCTLFHGELVPTKDATACYEPAYRLVRRFLDCLT